MCNATNTTLRIGSVLFLVKSRPRITSNQRGSASLASSTLSEITEFCAQLTSLTHVSVKSSHDTCSTAYENKFGSTVYDDVRSDVNTSTSKKSLTFRGTSKVVGPYQRLTTSLTVRFCTIGIYPLACYLSFVM